MRNEDILTIFFILREIIKLAKFFITECVKSPAQTIDIIVYYLLAFIFALDLTGIAITTYIIYLML